MFLWGLWIDPLYLLAFIITLVISGAAQLYIRSTFSRWSQVANSAGLSGAQVGELLVTRARFDGASGAATGISFKIVPGR
jgi:Zn-dependent membrane protease YugP